VLRAAPDDPIADGAALVAHRAHRDPSRAQSPGTRVRGRRIVPEIGPRDFDGGFSGLRAQALGRDGTLVDDFVVSETERALHVRNAPSPAATSSFALARLIADRAEPGLD
jgi:L-2-hydroxyglutarate oxidase LhgO